MAQAADYHVPHETRWPIVGSVGLLLTVVGGINLIHGAAIGKVVMALGAAIVIVMLFGWMGNVIRESEAGMNNAQMDRSYRWGMGWFIFSEVMFFAAFFGALFYARVLSVPFLGGEFNNAMTHAQLWPDFEAMWPLLKLPSPEGYDIATGTVGAWGVPAINTLILLSSGVTLTWAHWGLLKNNRSQLIIGLLLTVILGFTFLYLQVEEYGEAMSHLNLKLSSGIYGSTFYMLTGFHGFHVTLGAIMLTVILVRSIRGHFSVDNHFGFEAVAWYWHFVDVVWLLLFVLVYWI